MQTRVTKIIGFDGQIYSIDDVIPTDGEFGQGITGREILNQTSI